MARKQKYRRARRYYGRMRGYRVHRPKRFSILTGAGMVAGACASLSGGDSIVTSALKLKDGTITPKDFANTVTREMIGYDFEGKTWAVPSFTALTALGVVGSKVAGKFVKPTTFDAIPYIGKKIKL